ncbi:Class E vacuolar protein-sorting machinery protein hse1 [Hondaea fermentalgiana]|uniref:Class E vacuolar protein-sorting machinery protein hse1 n=1 Tax=Hondaea fermentalgiana TaxID=2315210 RepID=A0A2R5GNK9_9STRA|nr:Class E vacuolar protein-sorting machinery protein hse1 [Hondaea fermentalgiana]|eukprot:GBG31889.1 Class E vacuolar protein-sorting machinery protein hse1 [Hondaea fermentalgiana]
MLSEVKASMEEAASQSPLREQQEEPHTQDNPLALIETSTVHEEQKDAGAHAFADSDLFEMVALYDLVVPLMKPCVACATFSFRSENESDLSFDKGDMVTVDAAVGADWLRGRCGRRMGIFPRSYIQWIQGQDVPEAVHPGPDGLWRALVRFDYAKQQTNDLRLVRGTEVLVERPIDELWYQGRYVGENAEVGIFPQSYVELIAPGQIKAIASLDYDSPRLSFKAGEVIELLAKISPGTKMVGRVCAQEGVFPASHVKYDKLYDHKLPIMPEDWRVSSRNVTETDEPLAFTASSEPRFFRPVLEDFEQDAAVYENLYESKLPMASKIKTRKGNRNQPQNCVIA